MGFKRSFLMGFFLITLSIILIGEVRGIESGLYVLAINLMFVPLWGTIVLWSRPSGGDKRIWHIIQTSFALFLGILGIIAVVSHDLGRIMGIVAVFTILVLLFIFPLYLAKRSRDQLTYPSGEVKYFWAYQWIVMVVLAIKSNEPIKVFLLLLFGLIGGYLIIKGLIQLKKEW
ncbi:MAG: hypothetical protein PWQ79_156 [Thermococcaceae archaeon]|nr:hypothetical protein [Thermococcaceae archaeon]